MAELPYKRDEYGDVRDYMAYDQWDGWLGDDLGKLTDSIGAYEGLMKKLQLGDFVMPNKARENHLLPLLAGSKWEGVGTFSDIPPNERHAARDLVFNAIVQARAETRLGEHPWLQNWSEGDNLWYTAMQDAIAVYYYDDKAMYEQIMKGASAIQAKEGTVYGMNAFFDDDIAQKLKTAKTANDLAYGVDGHGKPVARTASTAQPEQPTTRSLTPPESTPAAQIRRPAVLLRPDDSAQAQPAATSQPQTGERTNAAAGAATPTALPDPEWTGRLRTAVVQASPGTINNEAAQVRTLVEEPATEADAILAGILAAHPRQFTDVIGVSRGEAGAGYGAFWLSKQAVERHGKTLDEVFASPKLQYEVARQEVECLLAEAKSNGRTSPRACAAYVAEKYRGKPDGWAKRLETLAGANIARIAPAQTTGAAASPAATPSAPSRALPPTQAPVTALARNIRIPTLQDATQWDKAVDERARALGRSLTPAERLDQMRVEGLYREILRAAGVSDPQVVKELERRSPGPFGRYDPKGATGAGFDMAAIDNRFPSGTLTLQDAATLGWTWMDAAKFQNDISAAQAAVQQARPTPAVARAPSRPASHTAGQTSSPERNMTQHLTM